jgi:hypothetical protein
MSIDIPKYFIRYEDTISNPVETFLDMGKFMLKRDQLEQTFFEKNVKELFEGALSRQIYVPRVGTSFHSNHRYSEEL